MRKIIFTLSFILIFSFAESQNTGKLTRNEKKTQKKAVSVEITDISGSLHKGYLWSADSVSLVLSRSMFSDSNLIKINFTDIYRLKFYKKQSYGQSFTRNLIITGGVTLAASSILMADAEDSMVGPGIIAMFLYTVGGLPANLLLSAADMKVIDIDYISNVNKSDDFIIPKKFTRKHSLSGNYPSGIESVAPSVSSGNIDKSILPPKRKHPKSSSIFHIGAAYNWSGNTLKNQFYSILQASDFSNYIYVADINSNIYSSAQYKLGVNATRNIRPFAAYQRFEGNYSGSYVLHESDLDIKIVDNSFTLGIDYVFAPVNKIFTKKYEISIGAAPTYSYYELSSIYNFNYNDEHRSTNTALGASISLAFDYYITRRFSLKAYGNYNVRENFTADDIYFFSVNDDRYLSIRNINLDTSNYNFGIGAFFHLIN